MLFPVGDSHNPNQPSTVEGDIIDLSLLSLGITEHPKSIKRESVDKVDESYPLEVKRVKDESLEVMGVKGEPQEDKQTTEEYQEVKQTTEEHQEDKQTTEEHQEVKQTTEEPLDIQTNNEPLDVQANKQPPKPIVLIRNGKNLNQQGEEVVEEVNMKDDSEIVFVRGGKREVKSTKGLFPVKRVTRELSSLPRLRQPNVTYSLDDESLKRLCSRFRSIPITTPETYVFSEIGPQPSIIITKDFPIVKEIQRPLPSRTL